MFRKRGLNMSSGKKKLTQKQKLKKVLKKILKEIRLFFLRIFYKYQWKQRKFCQFIGLKKYERNGKYIDGDVLKGFIATDGTEIRWGKQHYRLFFLGKVDR